MVRHQPRVGAQPADRAFPPIPKLNLPGSPGGAAATWFTADQHFGHTNIITYARRPYDSIDAHDQDLVDRWNARVAPQDWVFVLGDFALAGTLPRFAPLLAGRKVLIAGNHDRCWTQRGTRHRPDEVAAAREAGFEIVVGYGMARVTVAGLALPLLSHLPGSGKHPDRPGRHDRYRPEDPTGLCGHIHTAWMDNGGWVNVGVDAWDFAPISWAELVDFYPWLGSGQR